jgi:hypothetical protein
LLDGLAEDLVAHNSDLKRAIRLILGSRAYQLPAVSLDEQQHADYVFTGPAVRRMSAEQFRDALGALTGVWFEEPAAKFDFTAGESGERSRSELMPVSAQWIWSEPDAPTNANAGTVYFSKTIELDAVPAEAFVVAACDNSYTLYVNGKTVTSGKDWSRPDFKNIRPQLKRGTNVFAVVAKNHTPDNKPPGIDQPPRDGDRNPAGFIFYARLRDQDRVLDFASDRSWSCSKEKKDDWEKTGVTGPDAKPAAELGPASISPWKLNDKLASALSMASVHGEVRSALVPADPLTVALGRPPREQVSTTRPSAATTLQALELTNGDTLSKLLKNGATKLLAETKTDSGDEIVTRLYARSLGRKPTSRELKLTRGLLGESMAKEPLEDLLWSIAMLPEFQLIY